MREAQRKTVIIENNEIRKYNEKEKKRNQNERKAKMKQHTN